MPDYLETEEDTDNYLLEDGFSVLLEVQPADPLPELIVMASGLARAK